MEEDKKYDENRDEDPLAKEAEHAKSNEELIKEDERRARWLNALGDILGIFFRG